mgnify:CR=1 FL=1
MHVFCIELFMVVDVYKARMNMPILNREYSDAMRNLSSAEARALAVPLCTEVYYNYSLLQNNHSTRYVILRGDT